MDFSNQIILLAGLLALLSVLASTLTARLGIPLLLIFLVLGMLAGEDGPGGIHFQDVHAAYLIGSLALAIILFNGGLSTDLDSFWVGFWPAFWLATVGVAFTAVVTGFAATWLLQVDWMVGLLLGAIIGSTDAAAVFSILHSHNLRLKQRVDTTLQIESGINDPMAVFLTIALVAALAAGQTELDWGVVGQFVQQMGIGLAAGYLGGRFLGWLINRIVLSPGLYPLLAFSGGLLIYGITANTGGSGYLAVYLAGLILGNRPLQEAQNIRRFHDGMAWLSQIAMFLILGLLVTPSQLLPLAFQSLALAMTLIILSRPLAVTLCLLPFRFSWQEHLFIGWVGLRGAVPIVLALFPLLAGLEQGHTLFNVTFFVVILSLMIQGWTVSPAARLLGLGIPPDPNPIQRMQIDLPDQPGYKLVGYELIPNSPLVDQPHTSLVPRQVKMAAVMRGGALLDDKLPAVLQQGDYIYLFSRKEDLPALEWLFAAPHLPIRLEDRRFFGERVLDANASMAEIVAFYDLKVDPAASGGTLEDFLVKSFRKPAVGDRVRLDQVELVVREMQGQRIVRVGLKLGH